MKQTNASPKHSSWVYYLGTLAMLASMLLLPHLIPSWAEGITPAGVSIACVFVGAIIGILTTNDLILCALFAMGGLVINGIQTPAQVISSFMGASYVWQIVVLYALCYVIIRDNTGEVIARFLLTRRFTQKYPMVMVMMLLFAFGLAAAFMGVFGALIVGFTLLDGIYAEAGIEPKSKLARLLCLGAFITMCIGPMTIGSMAALNLAAGQFFLAAAGVGSHLPLRGGGLCHSHCLLRRLRSGPALPLPVRHPSPGPGRSGPGPGGQAPAPDPEAVDPPGRLSDHRPPLLHQPLLA